MEAITHTKIGFCALEYRPQAENRVDSSGSILILIVRTPHKAARVLIDPGWRSIVIPADREYISGLLADFKARATLDIEALLNQASSLSVGPLITHSTGAELSGHPKLLTLSQSFIEI